MSESTDTGRSHDPLPVKEIFLIGALAPIKHLREVVKAGYPLLLLLLAALAVKWLPGVSPNTPQTNFFSALLSILTFVFAIAAAVGCHRIFIIGPGSIENRRLVWFGRSQLRYFGWSWLIGLLGSLAMTPLIFFLMDELTKPDDAFRYISAQIAFGLPIAYIGSRLALLLPAAATNFKPELSLGWAWDVSSKNQLELFLLIGMFPLATEILLGAIPEQHNFFYDVATGFVWLYVGIAELAFLSYSFKYLCSGEDSE